MDDSFNVFVIGPMGADKDKPSESGTPISQHMENIAAALRAIMPRYVKPPSRWEVFSPLEGATAITDYVFTHIDDADLAVADITSRSPSVMYELAYFHALGTPMIVLDDSGRPEDALPFYLKDVNVLPIKDFSVGTLTKELNERVQQLFNPDIYQDFGKNPITGFYGAPLMEISGAATIARGYYSNFLRGFIDSNNGIAVSYEEGDIDRIYVLKPSPNLSLKSDFDLFEAAMGGSDEHVFVTRTAKKKRKATAHYDGRAVFDLPRTVYTLAHSPRVQRLQNAIVEMQNVSAERKAEMVARSLSGLVERFYKSIETSILRDEHVLGDMIEFIDVSEVEDFVHTP